VDPNLVGVWQNQSDDKDYLMVRADGTLRWLYRGDPIAGIRDFIVEYTYHVDTTKSPAHLNLIHQGTMKTTYLIYEVAGDELRIGVGNGKSATRNQVEGFGAKDTSYKRVPNEPGK
jgi:uncharacterized protein (TIGR03067 family)